MGATLPTLNTWPRSSATPRSRCLRPATRERYSEFRERRRRPQLRLSWVNVHVCSRIGAGDTDGTGNLIVGWNDLQFAATQRGGTPSVDLP